MIALVVDQQLPDLGVAARLAGLSGLGDQILGDVADRTGLLVDLEDFDGLDAAGADFADDLGAGVVVAIEGGELVSEPAVRTFRKIKRTRVRRRRAADDRGRVELSSHARRCAISNWPPVCIQADWRLWQP